MTWTLVQSQGPSTLPVTVAEIKANLNLSSANTIHDEKILDRIKAAVEQVEQDATITVMSQTLQYHADTWQMTFRLPTKPVQSISAIKYIDVDGVEQTVDSSVYKFSRASQRIYLGYEQSWPTARTEPEAITIEYVGGYGDQPKNIPSLVKQAIILQASKWFANPDGMASEPMTGNDRAYESIIQKLMYSHYP